MPYVPNRGYSTRNSGRFNPPGNFGPTAELAPGAERSNNPHAGNRQQQSYNNQQQSYNTQPPNQFQHEQLYQQHEQYVPQPLQPQQPQQEQPKNEDVDMKPTGADSADTSKQTGRPTWMKPRVGLDGVVKPKIKNKERRRRQNENLRRLLTPKNALMVLYELNPGEQITNNFKVEAAGMTPMAGGTNRNTYCAELNLNGETYKGIGDSKVSARNVAAEQAIRDIVIKKLSKMIPQDGEANDGDGDDDSTLPMIQLCSFALFKLFSEWEYEGHKVPPFKVMSGSMSEGLDEVLPQKPSGPKIRTVADLPPTAAEMHPCMLLTYMRPQVEYRDLAIEGDRPQNIMFTIGVDVDGATYVGKACNKREARRSAARSACETLFGVVFKPPTA